MPVELGNSTATRRFRVAVSQLERVRSPELDSDASQEGLTQIGSYGDGLTSRRRNARNRGVLTREPRFRQLNCQEITHHMP